MTMNYAYSPSIWPSFFTFLLLSALAVYSGRRRSVPGALPFTIGSLFGALWVAGFIMETAAVDMDTKIFWFKVQGVSQLPAITALTCSILEYAWPGRWLTRRNLILLSIPCLLILGLALTNNLHHLIWRGFEYDGTIIPLRGPANWIFFIYAYGLTIVNLIVFAWLFLRSPQHRLPVSIMLTGMVAGRLLFLLETARILQSEVPPFALEYLMYAIALFGFRIFDPIPLARQTAIEQLHSGMLVLDPQGKIVGLNPAACAIFESPQKRLLGRPIQDLLPVGTGYIVDHTAVEEGKGEICLGSGPDTCYYRAEASSLNDWRGLEVGRLLLLHDVTEQKRAQAQLLEQQRALAILTERERLARELHDDLGQVLAFISTQGHVIQQLLVRSDVSTASSYVARLIEAADEADIDIRESILSLRAPFNRQGLIPALLDYLRRYEGRYGLHIELLLPECGLENAFEPVAEVQILRILQEGLTNARKHASAHCVQVAFVSLDGRIQISLRDDGKGFKPGKFQDDPRRGFGLQFMRERAEAIGGSLELRTVPGKGTEILLVVPLKKSDA
jgi:signal transduction histidine kinase